MKAAWAQFLQAYDCPNCGNADGRTWIKEGVYIAVAPCTKHLRMFERQGWLLYQKRVDDRSPTRLAFEGRTPDAAYTARRPRLRPSRDTR